MEQSTAPGSGGKISFDLDPRTLETVKWSAVWYAAAQGIMNVAGQASSYFMGGYAGDLARAFGVSVGSFSVRVLVMDVIWGAVYGAIFGFILSKFYSKIRELNIKFLKGKLNTLFKLLFYPSLVGSLLGFLLATGAASQYTGITPFLIIFAGGIGGSYVYALMLTKQVGSQYTPPA